MRACDAAAAGLNESDELFDFVAGEFFDLFQSFSEPQVGAVEKLVSILQRGDLRRGETGAAQTDYVEADRFDVEAGVKEERRRIEVYARVAANHRRVFRFASAGE